jgi:IS4 transposase
MADGAAESVGEDYRSRWGIETGFRVIKEDFLAKSRSTTATMRTWYFNFAAHLYNLWVTANVVRAHDTGEELAGDYPFTAGRLMQAIEDDPYEANIRAEPSETLDFFDGLFL